MVYSNYGPDRETGAVCDYQMYDRIWQRVSPDLNPYPHLRDGGEGEVTPPEEVSSFPPRVSPLSTWALASTSCQGITTPAPWLQKTESAGFSVSRSRS